jgi:hypothetical protein
MQMATTKAPYLYPLPDGVSRALRRLESACQKDGVDSMRLDYHDGKMHVYVDDSSGRVHYLTRQKANWLELRDLK